MNNPISYDLDSVFFPSSPITSRDLFLGRFEQIKLTCDAINERGQHFVIYGERGVGKTSLANIINTQLSNIVVAKVTCNRSENFRQVWTKALSKIRFESESQGSGFLPQKTYQGAQLDIFLPDGDTIDSLDIQSVFERLQTPLLLIFDEFDSVVDPDFKISFADTMKNLSDNASHVTIGVVGVAESVNDLIGEHPSLERCLRQILMPRMSKDELHQIIEKGLSLDIPTDDARGFRANPARHSER